MSPTLSRLFLVLSLLFFPATLVAEVVVNAASCSQSDVQAALNKVTDGAIVAIPAGTCTWNVSVRADLKTTPRAVTIRGAGMDQTVLIDEVPRVNANGTMLSVSTAPTKSFRLTGMTFKSSSRVADTSNSGMVTISGESHSIRIDHNKFDTTRAAARAIMTTDWVLGVIDHNVFDVANQALTVWHATWGGKLCGTSQGCGDGSWAEPLTLGSENAVYFEDNQVLGKGGALGVIDGYYGARYVIRHNTFTSCHVTTRGTDISGRARGIFSYEVYDNTFTLEKGIPSYFTAFDVRGGTGVFYNNSVAGGYQSLALLNNYRSDDSFSPFGTCDSSSNFDMADPTIYASGTHVGSYATNGILTVTAANWSIPNQWVGYSLRNITRNWGAQVNASTANSVSVSPLHYPPSPNWDLGDNFIIVKADGTTADSGTHTGATFTNGTLTTSGKNWTVNQFVGLNLENVTKGWGAKITANFTNVIQVDSAANYPRARTWKAGDVYQIRKVEACLDQVGRSSGDLITGGETAPTPRTWPHQILEPFYAWNNTLGGAPSSAISSTAYTVRAGSEYFTNTARPNYQPYLYPHPLVKPSAQTPHTPTNLELQ